MLPLTSQASPDLLETFLSFHVNRHLSVFLNVCPVDFCNAFLFFFFFNVFLV